MLAFCCFVVRGDAGAIMPSKGGGDEDTVSETWIFFGAVIHPCVSLNDMLVVTLDGRT
jgi:hypothetical protein